MGFALGAPIVFGHLLPDGLVPIALEHSQNFEPLPGKRPELIVLNERPINAETPPHLLNDEVTPADLFFVRNNGLPPSASDINPETWTIRFDGEALRTEKSFTLAELKKKFKTYTYHLTLECGGNGRKEFNPPAKGNQWGLGAVGCAAWTGVRLKDVLESIGINSDAVYIGYFGKDAHLSGDPNKDPISRGVPMKKALEEESLIAWAMNGQDLPLLNGYPVRLVFGGWPASCSGKWLERISVRDRVHDGAKMTGQSYRVPCKPVAPGSKVVDEDMCIIESMPVKSLITYPKTGAQIKLNQQLPIKGHAWAGDLQIDKVEYSIDFGSTWKSCTLENPINRLAWQHFEAKVEFPEQGYYEVWARATDSNGKSQPMLLPGWNPKGYLNNACHRIAIRVL
jgi:DMSO/TMAO reductase YedYZ molybdopterin-dependent catalytic subunit